MTQIERVEQYIKRLEDEIERSVWNSPRTETLQTYLVTLKIIHTQMALSNLTSGNVSGLDDTLPDDYRTERDVKGFFNE